MHSCFDGVHESGGSTVRRRESAGNAGEAPLATLGSEVCAPDEGLTEPTLAELRGLLDGIDALVWEAAPDGTTRYIGRRARELFGYSEQAWLAQRGFWHEIAHPDDRILARDHFLCCVSDGKDRELEYRIIAADGRIVWVHTSLRVNRDHGERVQSLRGVMWRVGRRRKIERQLYAARQELADHLADITHLHDLNRRLWATVELEPLLDEILTAARAIQGAEMGMIRLYDPERDELELVAGIGLPQPFLEHYRRIPAREVACGLVIEDPPAALLDRVDSDPKSVPSWQRAQIGRYRATYTTRMMSHGGALLGTITTCFREPHRPLAREVHLVEMFAVQAADFLENAQRNQALNEVNRRKDAALATLAHELRNPLNVILNATAALEPAENGDPAATGLRDVIVRQARLMSRLVNDLFDVSRDGRGDVALNLAPVDLRAMMVCAAGSVHLLVEERGHELTMIPPREPIVLEADAIRLEQILVNLLTNACRYTNPGGKITLEAWKENGKAVLRVRDTGIGIAREMLPRIFDPFVQARREPGARVEGLGLGLALVKILVEQHGGSVTAASKGAGCGSEFVVRLPTGRNHVGKPQSPADSRPPRATSAAQILNIMVVDDQDDLARCLARVLLSWGHQVRVAHDGPSALAQVDEQRPDLILLDIGLPGIDGYEVARRVRARHGAAVRIVALSGFGRGEAEREPGALLDGHLTKPVSPEDLRTFLQK